MPDALTFEISDLGQKVLALQGGGAIGAFQAGVYQALSEHGVEPDWIVGTSIGAINGAIIAGNTKQDRLPRLHEFWNRVAIDGSVPGLFHKQFEAIALNWKAITMGVSGFFSPNPFAFLNPDLSLGVDHAGYYSTEPLRQTLHDLVNFEMLNAGALRLTVGTANVRASEMRYFDSRDETIDVRHIMASGALPPAFPAVEIDGEHYWDGGILSNTPVEIVFDDHPRNSSVIFSVHLWNTDGPVPQTMRDVASRQKEMRYASRSLSHIKRQRQIHDLRHVVNDLAEFIPEHLRDDPVVKELLDYGCQTRMHVIRLLAPALDQEDYSKDIDFSRVGIQARWSAGYRQATQMLADRPWRQLHDPREGFILHEDVVS